jgi:hypothetical protein
MIRKRCCRKCSYLSSSENIRAIITFFFLFFEIFCVSVFFCFFCNLCMIWLQLRHAVFCSLFFFKYLAYIKIICNENCFDLRINIWTQLIFTDSRGKGKSILLKALTGPEDSRRKRLPDFKTICT